MFTTQSRSAINDFILNNKDYRALLPDTNLVTAKSIDLDSMLPKAGVTASESANTGEIKKYFTLNQTGNIMISSTVPNDTDLSSDVKEVFQKTSIFFGAWSAALKEKNKSLYDYDALMKMITKSGFFVQVHEEDRDFESGSASLTLDTAIIGSVLSGFASMGGTTALNLAKTVIGNMGKELTLAAKRNEENKKIAHLLFVCENLMGMPILNVMLFNTSAKESETVTSSKCHKSATNKVSMKYHQDTFLFVDPAYINKFSKAFESNQNYKDLIGKLAAYID